MYTYLPTRKVIDHLLILHLNTHRVHNFLGSNTEKRPSEIHLGRSKFRPPLKQNQYKEIMLEIPLFSIREWSLFLNRAALRLSKINHKDASSE